MTNYKSICTSRNDTVKLTLIGKKSLKWPHTFQLLTNLLLLPPDRHFRYFKHFDLLKYSYCIFIFLMFAGNVYTEKSTLSKSDKMVIVWFLLFDLSMSVAPFAIQDVTSSTFLRGVPVHHQPHEAQNGERPQWGKHKIHHQEYTCQSWRCKWSHVRKYTDPFIVLQQRKYHTLSWSNATIIVSDAESAFIDQVGILPRKRKLSTHCRTLIASINRFLWVFSLAIPAT